MKITKHVRKVVLDLVTDEREKRGLEQYKI
jgi:hypothetical protein